MRRRKRQRIYWRGGRAYGDFRDYADVGGGQERLIVPGEKLATTNAEVAEVLMAQRLAELNRLRAQRQGRVVHGLPKTIRLAAAVEGHLLAKAKAKNVTESWLAESRHFLARAVAFFGPDRELSDITVADVTRWAEALLATRPTGRRAETMSGGTVRHYLNALSNLYRRAQAEGYVVPGYNPVSAMLEKPAARRGEALWLEVPDASLLLEAARLHDPTFAYPLIATFLLSGGRESEVLGLEVRDVSTDRRIVTFRPNRWRRLKTAASCRTVPLWPQLREILGAYLVQRPPAQLLFPSYRTGEEAMLTDWRKLLDKVASRAGWEPGQIRSKMFRHTYCAARLQTLDHGAPVSVYTVAREMGHGGEAMVRRVYGHLGAVRHRSEVVEYRVQQHRKVLGNRLKTLFKQAHTPRPAGVGARS
jgi:integrase